MKYAIAIVVLSGCTLQDSEQTTSTPYELRGECLEFVQACEHQAWLSCEGGTEDGAFQQSTKAPVSHFFDYCEDGGGTVAVKCWDELGEINHRCPGEFDDPNPPPDNHVCPSEPVADTCIITAERCEGVVHLDCEGGVFEELATFYHVEVGEQQCACSLANTPDEFPSCREYFNRCADGGGAMIVRCWEDDEVVDVCDHRGL